MAKITYNGMELDEVTEPQIFDPPKTMVVWEDDEKPKTAVVIAILAESSNLQYRVAINDCSFYQHCALIPEKPAPRMATNRELSKWLAQGNGEVLTLMQTANRNPREMVETAWHYFSGEYNETVDYGFEGQRCKGVRKWDDAEWHTPDVEYMAITEVKTYEDVVKREG